MQKINIIEIMHRLLLEEIDGTNAERFVGKAIDPSALPRGIDGQIQWITAFWAEEINNTKAMNALEWITFLRRAYTIKEFEIAAKEHLIPILRDLNLPRK